MFRRLTYYAVLAALIFLSSTVAMAARCIQISSHPHYIAFPSGNFTNGRLQPLHFDPACQDDSEVSLGQIGPGTAYASSFGRAMSICQANISQTVTAVNNPYPDRNLWDCQTFSLPDRLGPDDRYVGRVNVRDASAALESCNRGYRQHPTNFVQKVSGERNAWHCYYIRGLSRGASGSGDAPSPCGPLVLLSLDGLRLEAFDGMNSGMRRGTSSTDSTNATLAIRKF